MATLSDAQRKEIWADIMRRLSEAREPIALTKQDLRAAVDAADAWVDANAASFNAALPQPARSALTTAQKSRILALIVEARFGAGV